MFLRRQQSLPSSRISQQFMEPEATLPCPQEPATGLYSEPDEPNPTPRPKILRFFKIHCCQWTCSAQTLNSTCQVCPLYKYFAQVIPKTPSKSEVTYNISHIARSCVSWWVVSPKQNSHTGRLPVTAYSKYSQLPSTSGGCLLRPQPEDAPCYGDMGPTFKHVISINQNFMKL
jgi:hypothetical protein